MSNPKWYRYDWVWEKTQPTGFLNAKKIPMRAHEQILVFYKKQPTYNPQKTTGHQRKVSSAEHKKNCKMTTNYNEHALHTYDSTERYPRSVIKFAKDVQKSAMHPTQKPLALCEYIIKTYTDEGDIVLDNCIGGGTTAEACVKTGRKYIGFETEKQYYDLACERVKLAL